MLELRLMRQFVAVAEELNFRRAAARLHMSQPPLSVAMQNLETLVGTALLDRSRHHVRLTPAGQAFHRDVRRLLQQAEEAQARARRVGAGLEGVLRLALVPSAALDVLPAILKRFKHDYPDVHLELTPETTSRQIAELRDGRVDLALVVGPVSDARGLVVTNLQAQAFVIAVPAGHPLARRRCVRMRELAAEPFVSFPAAEGAGFAAALVAACRSAGFLPRVAQEGAQMQVILTLVAGGLGIALVPAAMRRLRMEDVRFLDIVGGRSPPTYRLAFAHADDNDNPVVRGFVASARRAVKDALRARPPA